MIQLFFEFLHKTFGAKIPTVFHYTSTRMMLAALTTLLISIFLGPWFIRQLMILKIGQNIRTEECPLLGELHAKKGQTPTMGGILMLFSMTIALLLWMDLTSPFTMILLATTLFLGFLGGTDDYLKLKYKNTKGLSGRKKMIGQIGFSALVALYLLSPMVQEKVQFGNWFVAPKIKVETYGKTDEIPKTITLTEHAKQLYAPFFKGSLVTMWPAAAFLFMIIVITGSSNAVNLTDGLDGLAAGCLLLVAICLGAIAFLSNNSDLAAYLNIAYIEGAGEIAVYLCAFSGACLGFLWYNGHPAQVFMGDIGSLTLGAIMGVSAVLLKRELLLAVVGGIFVAEALSVIIQVASYRLRNKKRVFLCAPLHHHFEYKGWPETKVVLRFWIIGLLLAIIGLASLKFQ